MSTMILYLLVGHELEEPPLPLLTFRLYSVSILGLVWLDICVLSPFWVCFCWIYILSSVPCMFSLQFRECSVFRSMYVLSLRLSTFINLSMYCLYSFYFPIGIVDQFGLQGWWRWSWWDGFLEKIEEKKQSQLLKDDGRARVGVGRGVVNHKLLAPGGRSTKSC